ncbi:MAG: ATP-binding protein [bacterium]
MMAPGHKSFMGLRAAKHSSDLNLCLHVIAHEIRTPRDNGVGFPSRDSRKVFQLFRRLRNKSSVAGSGLGLTLVKQIIEGHGGEVWVESRKKQGATFFLTLPKQSPEAHV